MNYISLSRKIFNIFNYAFLILMACICLMPLVHVIAVSFSSGAAATAGLVKMWPVDFNTQSYVYVLHKKAFIQSIGISLERIVLSTIVNMLLIVLIAYPLSKEVSSFRLRTYIVWFFVFTMLFSGGLIPWYMTIKYTGLLDTIWALVLPTWGWGVYVFNVVLLLNFFRGLPKELEECSFVDGAGHWTIMWKIFIPLSLPAIATITLFTLVFNWNSWFDGLILMNSPEHYPLSSYLQTVVINSDMTRVTDSELKSLKEVTDRTAKAAQIFLGALPILAVYPFLQKYFVKGIVLGSVKE